MMKIGNRLYREFTSKVSFGRARWLGLETRDWAFALRTLRRGQSRAEWCNEFAAALGRRSLLAGVTEFGALIGAEERRRILCEADAVLRHEFDLFGSGLVRVAYGIECQGREGHVYRFMADSDRRACVKTGLVGYLPGHGDYEPIDWHIDFISGYRWSGKAWHANLQSLRAPGADIKVPWELARCNHLLTLAKAAALTGNDRYATEAVTQILDFILANPVGFGPAWACAMDVSIRVSNWILTLSCLAKLGRIDVEPAWRIVRSLADHARFIRSNLEWSAEVNGNHYTSDLTGLFFVGASCPELPGSARWERFARLRLEREIFRQVLPDGANFEASTAYHRLVYEMFLGAALLGQRIGRPFSKQYEQRLRRMTQVLRGLSFQNGELPQIGDNDSGRFLRLDSAPGDSLRMDHMLPLADWVLDERLQSYAQDVDGSALALCFGVGLGVRSSEGWQSRSGACFSDAGWAVLRNDGVECVVSCGPNGQGGNGGHAHNDKLSITVAIDGDLLVVDPGTYLYTAAPAQRNLYRSTRMHSTPQPGNAEISPISGSSFGLFTLTDRSGSQLRALGENSLAASHDGFGHRLAMNAELSAGCLAVAYSGEETLYTMRWHLAPGVCADATAVGAELTVVGRRYLLSTGTRPRIGSYQYSPAYGKKQLALVVEAQFMRRYQWAIGRIQS
jgi:hypothetical protein